MATITSNQTHGSGVTDLSFLAGGGEMGQLIRDYRWSHTSLGTPDTWPDSLVNTLGILLHSPFPMLLNWGEEMICFYNDAFRPSLGKEGRHPHILGRPAREAWPESWPTIEPLLNEVLLEGKAHLFHDRLVPIYRNGQVNDVYWTFSYSPVTDRTGKVCGVLAVCMETTRKVTMFHHVVEQAKAPIVIFKGEDLLIEEANLAFLELWNVDREAIGRPFPEVVPEMQDQSFLELLKEVYRTGDIQYETEKPAWHNQKNGTKKLYYFNYECKPYQEANGEISGVIALATDVTQQVLAKQQLAIAEDEMRIAIEAADLGYWNFNPLTNAFSCNERTQSLFGLPLSGKIALTHSIDQVYEQDRRKVVHALQKALDYNSGGGYDVEYRVVHPSSGETFYLKAKGQAYFTDEKIAYRFSGTVQDVTKTKKAEEELNYHKLLLETVTGNTTLSLFMLNSQRHVIYMNEAAEKMTGFTFAELKGKSLHQHTHHSYPDGRPYPLEACPLASALTEGQQRRGDEIFIRKDGSFFPVFYTASPIIVDGVPQGTVIEVRDTTEEKKKEQALEKSEERLRIAVEGGELGLFDHYPQTGQMIWSARTKELFGLPADAELNFDLYLQALHPDDRGRSAALVQRIMDPANGGRYENEYRTIGITDGKMRWVRSIGRIFFDSSGKAIRFTGIAQDITEQKRATEAVRKNELRYRNIFETVPVSLWEKDFSEAVKELDKLKKEHGAGLQGFLKANPEVVEWLESLVKIRDTNMASLKMFEADTKEDLLGGLQVTFTRQTLPVFTELLVAIAKGEKIFQSEYELKTLQGKKLNALVSVNLPQDDDYSSVLVCRYDITERKEQQQALQESEEQFRIATTAANVGTWSYDIAADKVNASAQYKKLFGSSPEREFTYQTFINAVVEEDRDYVNKANQEVMQLKNGNAMYELEYRIRGIDDGELRWLKAKGEVFTDKDGKPCRFAGAVQDVSKSKKAEEELRISEEKYRSLFRTMGQGFCIIDVIFNEQGEGIDYRFLEYNERFSEQCGLRDAVGKTMRDLVPDIESYWAQTYGKVAKTGEPVQLTEGSDIMNRWFDVYAYKAGDENSNQVAILFSDITEQKKAEAALRESEEKFHQLADFMPQIVWTSRPDGNTDYYNRQWNEYTGQQEACGDESWITVLHADDIKNYKDTWNNSVETGEPFQIEYRFKEAATGHYRWHLGKALPIRDRENRITKWFGTCTDIHDQKTFAGQLENLVAERTRALQRSNEDLQQFAHVASHDLKEPVRKIRTFSGRMKEEFAALLPEKASLYLTKIEKGADRMYDMIDGVLLYSSMEAMEQTSEEVDINDLMENIQADLEVVIVEKEAVISIEQIPPVEGAPILLYQLFYNLINNSLKFAKPNERPRITITSEVVSAPVAGELGVSKEKTFVRMVLQDNGIGFAQSDAERIFKTFLRLNSKDKFEGTGLGLSLCKKIVERHGGSIWAEGTPGEGAVFNILLPAFHESVM